MKLELHPTFRLSTHVGQLLGVHAVVVKVTLLTLCRALDSDRSILANSVECPRHNLLCLVWVLLAYLTEL